MRDSGDDKAIIKLTVNKPAANKPAVNKPAVNKHVEADDGRRWQIPL